MTHPLNKYLSDKKEAVSAFAGRCQTSRQTIYRIINDEARPSADMIARIIRETGGELSFDDLYREADA